MKNKQHPSILINFAMNKLSLLLLLFVFSPTIRGFAQVTLSLQMTEANALTTLPAGGQYTLQLAYSVSSTTGNATGVKVVVNLPTNIYDVRNFVGTSDAPASGFVYNAIAHTVTIPFNSPLASGSNGVLDIGVLTNNLITPNGTVLTSTATLADNAAHTSGVKTQSITVTAAPNICATKTLLSGGAINNPTTYRIRLNYGGGWGYGAPIGSLENTNLSIIDNLPAGATFISAKVYAFNGTFVSNATYSAGVVTASIPDLASIGYSNVNGWSTNSYYVVVVVQYNSPTFTAGSIVTNNATVNYTPLGGSATVLSNGQNIGGTCVTDLIETTTLANPIVSAIIAKNPLAMPTNIYPFGYFGYFVDFVNTGNVGLDNVEIIENIPSNIRLDASSSNQGVAFSGWAAYIDHGEYQTNLNATWQVQSSSITNFPASNLVTGEYYTALKFVLKSPFPAGAQLSANGSNILYFTPASDTLTAPQTVTNCLYWNSTTAGIPALATRTRCNSSFTLQPTPTTSSITYRSDISPRCAGPLVVGSTVTFTATVFSDAGFADPLNPVVAIFVPHGFQYIPGSMVFDPSGSGIAVTPTMQIVNNYMMLNGKSVDMYRFTFPSGTVMTANRQFVVSVATTITNALLPATAYVGDVVATASNASISKADYAYPDNFTDTQDWNLNGNTTEISGAAGSSYWDCSIGIASNASMTSLKWVKGQLDASYSHYPQFGYTVPGGLADYKLIAKNTGNVPMKNIKIVDIMPWIGDIGVIDPSTRNTQWRPNLAGPINAPAGITVYYTTYSNPCRDTSTLGIPSGCTNWSTSPPANITTVQSVLIDFGTTILGGGDSLVFNWPMRAPVNAPTNGEIAWNSFAFTGVRTDNNQALIPAEPIKVGIVVQPGVPAAFGDYIWYDANHNGIQDPTESGIDGVIVDLYIPTVSGVKNPATDSKVSFTITGNGGKYLFPNLPAGDYYAVFEVPTGYSISPQNASGSTASNNSDGATITLNGNTVTITNITHLTASQIDLTWDQGLYCLLSPSVSVAQTTTLGGSVTLTAAGGTTYLWSGPNGFSATTASITKNLISYSDTGTYTVNISNGVCYASAQTSIQIQPSGTVGNYVWNDMNHNGTNDEPASAGINGITVQLWNASTNTLVATTTTANNASGNPGYYNFIVTTTGSYYVHFPTSNGASTFLTTATSTAATDNNSDATTSTGYSPTFTITVNGTGIAKDNTTIDAGYYTCPTGCTPVSVNKH